MKLRYAILAQFIWLNGCSIAPSDECVGRSMDFGWVNIDGRNAYIDVSTALEKINSKTELIAELGQPDKVGGSEKPIVSWVRGSRREGRDCLDEGRYKSTFFISYAIIEAKFNSHGGNECGVFERIVISDSIDPDPYEALAIDEERLSCEAFLQKYKK